MYPPDVPAPLRVFHNRAASRFEVETDGHLSVVTYQLDADAHRVAFDHTGVPAILEGRGIAAELVAAALAWAEAEGLQVLPRCSYVAAYIRRHPDTRHLLEPHGAA